MSDGGALQLQAVGRRFKELAGLSANASAWSAQTGAASQSLGLPGRSLRAQLLAGIRAGTKPAVESVRQAARDELPKHGGLNEYVASSLIGTYSRITGPRVGVRIGVRKGAGAHKAYGANKGRIRHPVFAKGTQTRDKWHWVDQSVRPGWFDRTLEKETPAVVVVVTKTCELIAAELTRRGV